MQPSTDSNKCGINHNNTIISAKYRTYVLLVLTGVYILSFIDRQIITILQESIKQDLHLSDTQLGLMSGFTFAIFYVTFGIPIAKLADKGNRKNIITLSLIVWSGFTALAGMAQHFMHLLLARIGVGIGEAGGSPPAHSMISDLYPPEKRATALAVYSSGISIGILLGFMAGGWIDRHYGWRIAFFLVGVPGLLYALLLYVTVREPKRVCTHHNKTTTSNHSIKAVVLLLWRSKTFRYLGLGAGMSAYTSYATTSWMPPFLARVHGMQSDAIGLWLSMLFGVGGGLGFFMGGYLADKAGKADKRWYLWLPAAALVVAMPFSLTIYTGAHTTTGLMLIAIPAFFVSFYLAPCIAITHSLVDAGMRAMASAILFFVLNMVGLGCGPLFTGMISDYLAPAMGTASLRWALGTTVIANLAGAVFYMLAARTIQKELMH